MAFACAAYAFACFIAYKILDRLIRIPRVGNYGDRYIFVTGCDTGFGNLIAKRLDQLGCHVFAGCLTEKGETELKKKSSERLHAISLDVTRKESVRKALEYIKANLPRGKGLWGLLNNAGVLLDAGSPDWLTVDDFKNQCEVNLWGLIDVTLTFLPLVKKEKGRLVNCGSSLARTCFAAFVPYCMSKSAVEAFNDGVRRTMYYFGCKTCLIEPGGYWTQIGDCNELGRKCAETWQKASPEINAEYGEEYVKFMIETELDPNFSIASRRLTEVVGAYEHALLGRYPRARYLVGYDAKLIFAPLRVLPEWLADWILRLFQARRPLPAVLSKSKDQKTNNHRS